MPADSRTLDDEGVVISPRPLDEAAIELCTTQMRQPRQRRADLRAQVAAGELGARRLLELYGKAGAETVRAAFTEILDYAERRTRACLNELADGTRRARDVLEAREGDLEIVLEATVSGDEVCLDFTGTAEQHEGNLNCPLAVTHSACYFALRVLTDPDIPPSAGAYRPSGWSRRRAACSTRARRPRWWAATSRPPLGWPTSCWPPSGGPSGRER